MIKPIVEGDGEVEAMPLLLRRIAGERYGNWNPPLLRPGRYRSNRLIMKRDGVWTFGADLEKAAGHARNEKATALMILLDADDGCVKEMNESLAPQLAETTGFPVSSLVFAVREYESWFLASAETLQEGAQPYDRTPESRRDAKSELERHLNLQFPYNEKNDQPSYSQKIDLDLCEARSRSFRKLLKEFGKLLDGVAQTEPS